MDNSFSFGALDFGTPVNTAASFLKTELRCLFVSVHAKQEVFTTDASFLSASILAHSINRLLRPFQLLFSDVLILSEEQISNLKMVPRGFQTE